MSTDCSMVLSKHFIVLIKEMLFRYGLVCEGLNGIGGVGKDVPRRSGDVGGVFEVVIHGKGRKVDGEEFCLVIGVFADICMFGHPCGGSAEAGYSCTSGGTWVVQCRAVSEGNYICVLVVVDNLGISKNCLLPSGLG